MRKNDPFGIILNIEPNIESPNINIYIGNGRSGFSTNLNKDEQLELVELILNLHGIKKISHKHKITFS